MIQAKAIIVDLDGTLCNVEHRVHHVADKENADWKSFSLKMTEDTVNHWCLEIIEAMQAKGYKILFLTGRGERSRERTLAWLEKHQINYEDLYMRPLGDRREDWVVKKEIYQEEIEESYDVLFILEDRASVVKMWRDELGLTCLQCDWGDF